MLSKVALQDADEDIRDCIFVCDPLPSSVRCCSCVLLLVRPVQIPCGERLCEACYKAIRKKDEEPECPKRGAKLREVWRDVFADKEISELEVYCNRKEEGCSWQGKQALLKRHMKDECQYRSIIHKDEKKQLTMVKCPVCSEEIPEDKLSQHLELSCPDKDISCEVPGCTQQLQRKALSAHNKDSLIEHVAHITKTLNEVTMTLSSLKVPSGDEKTIAAIESIRVRINDVEEHCGDMEANQKIVQAKILEACYQSMDNLQKETRHVIDNLTRHFTMFTEKMLKFEEIVATQSQEISELKQNRDPAHDRVIASHDVRLAEHGVRLDLIDNKYQRGVLLWKIVASNMAEESLSHAVEETRHNALGDCPNFQTDDLESNNLRFCYCSKSSLSNGNSGSEFFCKENSDSSSLPPQLSPDRLCESLSETRRDFRTLQQNNTKAVEALTERISSLETQATDMQAHQRVVQTKILEACYQSVDNAQRDYRAKFDNVESHLRIMTEKMLKMEETITTQAARIRSLEDENNSLRTNAPSLSTSGMGTGSSLSPLIEQQFSQQDRILASHDIKLAEHGLRIDMLDCKNTEGVLLWKITDIRRRRREAVSGKTPSIYSQPFYTSGCGYKLCARLYLNGDGMGKGTHLSLFFVVMRGEYDALLPWPFQQKVTLVLMDQTYGRHVSDTFRPDPTSSSFKKPRNEMNIASGCPLFVPLSTLDGGDYIRDDTLFIKVVVDTSDVTRPDKR
ncbi:TNF receptor-associated factor 3-like isoform X2 [Oscarella lobularis]|uniref:TNF receptor-associated factor 3-like isoform X2 n=1 Tax=Oscarella lobularis TaxID=121494 RepID=UPI0033140FDC